tara:strand:+ start:56 stop:394 length:339 start_codon:yes stop_codon:yes gene_type:complete
MAEVFNRTQAALVTGGTDVYTAPTGSGDTVVVLSIMVANVDGTNAATVTGKINDSAGATLTGGMFAKTISVPANASLELIANKMVLKAGERINLSASVDGDLEATVSVLEIT